MPSGKQGLRSHAAAGFVVTRHGIHCAAGLRDAMTPLGVNIWTSSRSSSLIDMQRRGLHEVVRASVHYYNTEEEIDRFCALVAEVSPSLRR